jgi:hypothetical protein
VIWRYHLLDKMFGDIDMEICIERAETLKAVAKKIGIY